MPVPPGGTEGAGESANLLIAAMTALGTAIVAAAAQAVRGWRSEDRKPPEPGGNTRAIEAVVSKPVILERADLATIGDLPALIRELTPTLRDAFTLEKANAEMLSRLFKEMIDNQAEILRRVDRNDDRIQRTADGVQRLVTELDWAQRQRQEDLLRIARDGRHD